MILQNILFPEVGKCTEKKLYFRMEESNPYISGQKRIDLSRNEVITFDTYFNGLSIEKWNKYTKIGTVSIHLRLKGRFVVTLVSEEKIREDVTQAVLLEEIVEAEEMRELAFPYAAAEKGILSFRLKALEDGSAFEGGYYATEVKPEDVRDVKIGICICTFKRESFIENNIRILNKEILKNELSPLHDRLEVFISDNGKTLEADRLSSDKIHIFPNKNLGGAGGFTRDLIEIMTHNNEYGITHALLMDDDIIIEPESVVRTYRILSVLKDEYVDAFVGGAMLRRDKQNIQVESGAAWNGGFLNSLKSGLDLEDDESCLYNELEEYREYNAWWYCCFPMTIVTEDNLPLPIFIRGDDLEYGLRNMKTLVLMNGICVWHEPFENKYSSFLNYYIIRNQLIDNSFHCDWYRYSHLCSGLVKSCVKEITFFRYRNVDLILRGVNDFLKGPEYLMQLDGEQLHKDIMAAGYRAQALEDLDVKFSYPLYEETLQISEGIIGRIKRIILLNGVFLPAKGNDKLRCGRGYAIIPVEKAWSRYFYRKKKVLQYDVVSGKGFVTEKSILKTFGSLFKMAATCMYAAFTMGGAQKKYRTEGLKLRTYDFWKEYLGI